MSSDEYSYETIEKLFPWKAVIPIILLLWVPLTVIGLMVAFAESFWPAPVIMSGIMLSGIFAIAWGNKSKKEKWGVDRTLWIITSEGCASGYPPDVAKRIALLGTSSAMAMVGRKNWGGNSPEINMAKNITTVIHGLPVVPWETFATAEYLPEKCEIALYLPTGDVFLIHTNPDNYAYVMQLVRFYMGI